MRKIGKEKPTVYICDICGERQMKPFKKCPKCKKEVCYECTRTILGLDKKESIHIKINWDKHSFTRSAEYRD